MTYTWNMEGEFGDWLNDKIVCLTSTMTMQGCSDEMIAEAVDFLLAGLHKAFPDQVCVIPPRRKAMH